ncbi:subtilisin-like protease SBT1.1 [Tripterygium wilfordii]|uniref:subtilisin-like protease SBT1.1 n=1 Tax=Tripterygium wilfordii TaxID=458696 RepID=UPI0018F8163A|nr:subtilisin-like protease SBT1.1 [Tripterygium wilfordii]XP_038683451.1 subtilisin-like protease SBT1.1 [Tripterygium wilfordii]
MKLRSIWSMLLALLATTSFAIVEKQTYVVHMDKTKVVTSNLKQWYEGFMDSIYTLSTDEEEEEGTTPPELLYVYEHAISGFAAKLSTKQLESLKRMDGFLFATADKMLHAHTTHTPQFLGLQFNKGLWSESNLASDIVIGVLDTGIWPEHISFQDSGISAVPPRWKGTCENGTMFSPLNCNKKLIGARYFYKGYEASFGRINETDEFLSPRDANGHGTHTAATAGGSVVNNASLFGFASGSASGMMYTSRIAVYKVLWGIGADGGGAPSDILAGIDQAVADGVDVLSLSLGGGPMPYYLDDVAIASFGAINKGISVVCSAGNFGPSFFTVANSAPWIMTIAASYLDRSFSTTIKLGNGQTFEGSSLYTGNATSQLPLVYGKTAGGEGADFCTSGSLNQTLVKGKIILCRSGIISGEAKGEQVKMAGGAGMLLIEELFARSHVLPATSTGLLAGRAIIEYVNSSTITTASIDFQGTVYGTRAPMMAAFSSRGPNSVGLDVIKPDVTAPGMNILAAWPPIRSPSGLTSDKRSVLFNIISGTSMSCPHVSGLVALLRSFRKDWSPAAIKSALMTTAYTMDNTKSPIIDVASNSLPATPFHFGSGHVNPEAAADPGLVYDISPEDYLNYLCSLNYTSPQIAAISRSPFACQKNSTLQPGDLNYPSFAVNFVGEARNSSMTYTRTVTNVGTPNSNYTVQLEEPNGVAMMVEPKMLQFEELGQKLSYKVTFVGFKRDANVIFGSLVWVYGKYGVRSPIAVTWRNIGG